MSGGKEYTKEASTFYGSKEGNDTGILINCETVVEKEDFVSTGVLTYVFGDIIEIEIPQFDVFKLGDKAKVTVYSKSGLFVFETTVVAKEFGSLIVINPPENRKRFSEKREFPRISVKSKGVLRALSDPKRNQKQSFDEPIDFALENISMNGLGFSLTLDVDIHSESHLEVELDLGFPLSVVTQIVRKEKLDSITYYGAEYIEVPKEKTNALRAFILKNQVEMYFVKKREDKHKKAVQEKKFVANE
ncbi:PilZ domain-containing protein [Paenibacillus sp. GP183]|uniref:PilZ domain-containing protein n=1 Tax=Paenibacillus sp. GP183 TaxID=1882751 RepID=UPI000898CCEB|nr:PilZ domain-containing protein [Paenibacillus sp. GP183]SEC32022.1 PilZ domain-containing protein [Paenibacillus sp. GP183]